VFKIFLLFTAAEMMGGAHVIILLGCAVWVAWSKDVTVDINTGHDTSTCGNESTPCKSLNYTIANRLPSDCGSLSIIIRNGSYTYSLNDSKYQFTSCTCVCGQLNIIGGGNTNVNCSPGAGFAFVKCTEVNIINVTFNDCGAIHPGTSTASNSSNETLPVHTALYFSFCTNVTMLNVHVNHSVTTGVVMYNTINLSVVNSHFSDNSVTNDLEKPSNGGFYIEFCYCDPGNVSNNCTPHNNTEATYHFQSSYFTHNNALNINNDFNRTFYVPYKTNYFSFGRGGGLTIVLKGNASHNNIIVDDCHISYNAALWGGGAFVEFEDDSYNNSILFNNTNFAFNQVVDDPQGNGTGGGGARVDFLFFKDGFHNNNVTFNECDFTNNSANHGGGLSLLTTPEQNVVSPTNHLTLAGCTFYMNYASIGAAMDLSTWHSLKKGLPATVTIQNCIFSFNGLYDTDGTVYADCVPATFQESVLFFSNRASGLSVFGTGITFTDNCQAQFLHNQGWSGGAISLLGNAYIGIHPGTNFTFWNNSAFVEGGAIYALLTSRHDILSSRNCFLQYNDENVHPMDWNATFTFTNNTAPMGNSIYTTSLLPCVWGASYGDINYNLREVFNWTNKFFYHPDDSSQVSSGIASLSKSNHIDMDIIPGNITRLPVTPQDDWQHSTQGSVWLYPHDRQKVLVHPNLTADYKVAAHGHPGDFSEVLVVTDGPRNVSLTITMTLKQCPPGYKWNKDNRVCECSYENWRGILYCDDTSFTSYVARGYWVGYLLKTYNIANESSLVTVKCPSQYCNTFDTSFRRQLPSTADETIMDHMICGPQKRTGTLCGNCTSDHGVAINVRAFQFHCINCSNTKYSWVKYLLSEFLPLTIFFIIILFFDINIHSGVTSSIILFFQVFDALKIVSEDELPPPPYSSGLIRAIQFLYNIWNLQFFGTLLSPYCLANHLNTMDILLINYASGLYPFLLFFIVYLLNNLSFSFCSESDRLSRLRHHFRRCWYHLKWHVAVKKSILSGLATVWTLTYTKLALISFLIMSRTSLDGTAVATYQGTMPFLKKQHLRYAIPANIVLVLFVYFPATSLLCYPLVPQLMGRLKKVIPLDNYMLYHKVSSSLERPFIKLKPIIDCFQGSYKPRHEYFAGLLFWYRLFIFIVFAYSVQSDTYFWNITISLAFLVIVGVAQPFKKSRDNSVMLLSLANIIMISVLNIYLLDHDHSGPGQSAYNPDALQWWQLILVVLPLIFIIFYFMWKVKIKVEAWRRGVPPEGLYVNFSSTYEAVRADDPLLDFPAQIWDDSGRMDEDDAAEDDTYGEGSVSISSRHDNYSHSLSRRESDRRLQSDRNRSHTFSGTPSYGTINNGSNQSQ